MEESRFVRLAAVGRGSTSVVFAAFDVEQRRCEVGREKDRGDKRRFVAVKESSRGASLEREAQILRELAACEHIVE